MNRRKSKDYEMYLYAKAFSRSCRWVRVCTPPTRAEEVPSQVLLLKFLIGELPHIALFGMAVFVGQCLMWAALAGLVSEHWLGVSIGLQVVAAVGFLERPYYDDQ